MEFIADVFIYSKTGIAKQLKTFLRFAVFTILVPNATSTVQMPK